MWPQRKDVELPPTGASPQACPVVWAPCLHTGGRPLTGNNARCLSRGTGAWLCPLRRITWNEGFLGKHWMAPERNCRSYMQSIFTVFPVYCFPRSPGLPFLSIHPCNRSLGLWVCQPVNLSTYFIFIVTLLVWTLMPKSCAQKAPFSLLHDCLLFSLIPKPKSRLCSLSSWREIKPPESLCTLLPCTSLLTIATCALIFS